MNKTLLLACLSFITTVLPLNAQDPFGVRFAVIQRLEGGIGYLFFTGPDAGVFGTTVKGFGSGLGEELNLRTSFEPLLIGTNRINATIGIGHNISKFRFSDNIVPAISDEGMVSFAPDSNTDHFYQNTFFGYTKTKLVLSSFYLPLTLNYHINDDWLVSLGGFADWLFFAKYKMKYLMGDVRVKEVVKSPEMLDLPFNRYRFGVHAGLYFRKYGLGMSGTWYLTPMFKDGLGPQIHECRLTVQYDVLDYLNRK